MCGLFGFSTTENIKTLSSAFVVLALENQNRGRDSWGVTNGTDVVRSIGCIDRQWHKVPMRNKGLLLGHVRTATVGKVSVENAHPFIYKGKHRVIGAHNGHIGNYSELNKQYERGFEVDSMHIFAHIAEDRPMDELEGSGAITFLKNNGLYLCRFNGGSLSIAQLLNDEKQPIGLAWSSLEMDLKKALDGSGVGYEVYKVENDHIYFWADNQLKDSKQLINISGYTTKTTSMNSIMGGSHNRMRQRWNYQTGQWEPSDTASKSITDKRIIRLRVVKPLANARSTAPIVLDKEAQALEDIKKRVFNDSNICVDSRDMNECHKCKDKTTLKLLGAQHTCLTCIAKMVQKAEIILPEFAATDKL